MSAPVYLDHNAGAPARPQVVAAMAAVLARGGNPSSVHAAGRAARAGMERDRRAIAACVGADPAGVVFTSGGTEANALALRGCGRARALVSDLEHPSVRDARTDAERLPVLADGTLDLVALERALVADQRPAVVAIMLANNETGVIQPVAEAARIAHAHGALVHCDAAQGLGRLPVSLSDLDVDFLTLSAHKIGGPAGIGCLVSLKTDISLAPLLLGGGQERRRRAGTENLAGIAGFAVAADLAVAEVAEGAATNTLRRLRDHLETEVAARIPQAVIVGGSCPRLCNTSCLVLPGVPAELQVMALDLAGVMVSAGSACSSGKVAASPVLAAMGLGPDLAGCAIRVSLGTGNGEDDVDCFLAAWVALARRKGLNVTDAALGAA